jgi:hypothetical protein
VPKNEPDPSDPLELIAAGDDLGQASTSLMAECLAEEFLALGHPAHDVMALFRSPAYALAHRAWLELGEVRVFAMVSEKARLRAGSRFARGGTDA